MKNIQELILLQILNFFLIKLVYLLHSSLYKNNKYLFFIINYYFYLNNFNRKLFNYNFIKNY